MSKISILSLVFASVFALIILPFSVYSFRFGMNGLFSDLSSETHLYSTRSAAANLAIFGHMIAGAIITLFVLIQVVPVLRGRLPKLHRINGRLIVVASLLASFGGLYYIFSRGTIGGRSMDIAFALYGIAMFVCALHTIRFARNREFVQHRAWALRLFVLCLGSWAYRVHYGLWELATDGLWIEPGYSGPFDLANLYLFYVPYLAGVEIYLRMSRGSNVAGV